MTSSINPGNIDGTFPTAGQDNDSQGFRDNFTNIKNNFTFAKSEIEAVQLSSASLTSSNDFSGNIIKNAEFQDNSLTVVAKGTTSGTVTFNHTQGHVQTLTTSGNTTFAFTGYPATAKQGKILVVLTLANNNHIITLPVSVTTPPDFVISVDGAGTYWYEFVSNDGGTTYYLFDKTRSYGNNTAGLDITGSTISSRLTNTDVNINPNGTGNIELQKDTNVTGNLDIDGNVTSGGIWRVDVDGTAINASGSLGFGAVATDSAIYWNGTNLILDSTGALGVSISGASVGTWDTGGIDLVTGDTYAINSVDVLSATTLGASVVNSSLTSVGTLNSLTVDQITIIGNHITSNVTNANIQLSPNGTGDVEFRISEQTTVGAAGGANALPAAPTGYMQININGRQMVVPFYAVS